MVKVVGLVVALFALFLVAFANPEDYGKLIRLLSLQQEKPKKIYFIEDIFYFYIKYTR